jgi:hypothetical protein
MYGSKFDGLVQWESFVLFLPKSTKSYILEGPKTCFFIKVFIQELII